MRSIVCVKCKRRFEASELLKCGLCCRSACVRCAVKRYGRKFCSTHCVSYFGLEDEQYDFTIQADEEKRQASI